MFKGYDFDLDQGYSEHPITGEKGYLVRIVDDDFEEMVWAGSRISVAVENALIDCYTKRGLPVAPNMIRYMLEFHRRYAKVGNGWSVDTQVKWHKEHNPRWHEVEQDMQMYLALI